MSLFRGPCIGAHFDGEVRFGAYEVVGFCWMDQTSIPQVWCPEVDTVETTAVVHTERYRWDGKAWRWIDPAPSTKGEP